MYIDRLREGVRILRRLNIQGEVGVKFIFVFS